MISTHRIFDASKLRPSTLLTISNTLSVLPPVQVQIARPLAVRRQSLAPQCPGYGTSDVVALALPPRDAEGLHDCDLATLDGLTGVLCQDVGGG